MRRPLIGITADFAEGYTRLRRTYTDMVAAAGGVPVVLPTTPGLRDAMLEQVDGVIVTGGDDIDVARRSGIPLHAEAKCMVPSGRTRSSRSSTRSPRAPRHPSSASASACS